MKKFRVMILALLMALPFGAKADEGMWLLQLLEKMNIKDMKAAADTISCDDKIVDYIVNILSVTRPAAVKEKASHDISHDITRYIHFGASPRAGIAMLSCAKVRALFAGRECVLPEDVKAVALNVLRHRLVLSYEAAADNVSADEIISRILDFIPVP